MQDITLEIASLCESNHYKNCILYLSLICIFSDSISVSSIPNNSQALLLVSSLSLAHYLPKPPKLL